MQTRRTRERRTISPEVQTKADLVREKNRGFQKRYRDRVRDTRAEAQESYATLRQDVEEAISRKAKLEQECLQLQQQLDYLLVHTGPFIPGLVHYTQRGQLLKPGIKLIHGCQVELPFTNVRNMGFQEHRSIMVALAEAMREQLKSFEDCSEDCEPSAKLQALLNEKHGFASYFWAHSWPMLTVWYNLASPSASVSEEEFARGSSIIEDLKLTNDQLHWISNIRGALVQIHAVLMHERFCLSTLAAKLDPTDHVGWEQLKIAVVENMEKDMLAIIRFYLIIWTYKVLDTVQEAKLIVETVEKGLSFQATWQLVAEQAFGKHMMLDAELDADALGPSYRLPDPFRHRLIPFSIRLSQLASSIAAMNAGNMTMPGEFKQPYQ